MKLVEQVNAKRRLQKSLVRQNLTWNHLEKKRGDPETNVGDYWRQSGSGDKTTKMTLNIVDKIGNYNGNRHQGNKKGMKSHRENCFVLWSSVEEYACTNVPSNGFKARTKQCII
jgi:hypothetical protein